MTPDVVAVKALPNYVIEAEFADGEVRRFSMQPYLAYPALADLRKDGLFMRAHVMNGAVTWNDETDLAPNTLYLRGARVHQEQ